MLHTIQNSAMSVTVDELGAQLMRITAADGTEYLWSGDPVFSVHGLCGLCVLFFPFFFIFPAVRLCCFLQCP
ncbi:MAG: hypothetical protein HFF64_09720, partial [Oscillospiraceae bacterium]|nr:hypothetical protein [Oscillospiraceae bacterium]